MDDVVVIDFLLVEGQVDPLRASRLFGSIHFDRHSDCFSSTGRWLSTASSWPANTAYNDKRYKLIRDFPGSTMILRAAAEMLLDVDKKESPGWIYWVHRWWSARPSSPKGCHFTQPATIFTAAVDCNIWADPDGAGHYIAFYIRQCCMRSLPTIISSCWSWLLTRDDWEIGFVGEFASVAAGVVHEHARPLLDTYMTSSRA
jgi:hypothetical protein